MLHHLSRAARFLAIALTALLVTACSGSEEEAAAPKTEFNIGWSIYAGWMPWPYAEQAGIVKKWGDKYGITIKFVQVNDYIESVNQYTAGKCGRYCLAGSQLSEPVSPITKDWSKPRLLGRFSGSLPTFHLPVMAVR